MFHQMSGLSLQYPLRTISFFIVHLLSHVCTGHSQLIGSPQPIVAKVGDDVILPCHLETAVDVAAKTFEWARPDLDPRFVYVWRGGQELHPPKNPSYKGRTTLFTDELKHGNISLNLSKVKPSDEGRYKCYIPDMNTDSSVELVVEAVSSPVISLSGIDRDEGGVVLQCESAGWYPEPEVFWLDGEGNLLSAGPTETVRGPDDLYTVSSRVTVEKRHSNSFTCRVQQKDINQTRETHIQVPDDFFEFQSSLSPITIGLAVCLAVCIMIILLLIISAWKWRQNRIKSKRSHRDETDKGEQMVCFKSNKPEVQVDIEGEKEQLMTDETVTTKDLKNRKGERETKHFKEQQRRDEAEKRVQTLKEELDTKRNEVETKQAELQQLQEEKLRKENDLIQTLKDELENKNKELERNQTSIGSRFLSWAQSKKEPEKETPKTKLETLEMELNTKTKEIEAKQAEVQQLQDQIQSTETILQTENRELERSRVAAVQPSSSLWPIVSRQKFQDEQQRREEAEKRVQTLEEEVESLTAEVQKNKQENQKSEEDKKQLQQETKEMTNNTTNVEVAEEPSHLPVTQMNEAAGTNNTSLQMTNNTTNVMGAVDPSLLSVTQTDEAADPNNTPLQQEPEFKSQQQDVTSSDSQSSTGHVMEVEFERWKNCIYLKNTSSEDQELRGWTLKVQVSDRESISYTFEKSFKLSPGETLTMGGPNRSHPSDLVWEDLKLCSSGDKPQVFLFSNTGESQHISVLTF